MGDLDDFGELYADLEERLIAGVSKAVAVEEDKNELEERAVGYENVAMESESNSDSEDDLQIVLNEEDYPNKLPAQLIAEGRYFKEDEGDNLIIVTGSDCSGKEPKWAEQGHSADGLLQGNGNGGKGTKGAHRNWSKPCLSGSAVRSWSGRGHCDHLTVPYSLGRTSYNPAFLMAFSNGRGLYLPRNWSIFNIDFESFEYKPWRFNGVDITDYFNFGLDEEGWRTYCNQLPTGLMSGEVVQHGRDNGLEILDYLDNGRTAIKVPKGRAIQVESGNGDRIPSIDVRRPRNRDSDVVIQITTGVAAEDAVNPVKNRTTCMYDNVSKSELLLNSKNELCKSSFSVGTSARKCEGSSNSSECPHLYMTKLFDEKLDDMNCGKDCPSSVMSLSKPDAIITGHYSSSSKSSCHNDFFQASRDKVSLEKVASRDCIHLNSDSLLQESVLSRCYLSSETETETSETETDTSKTDRTSCGGNYPESTLDQNYCQKTTICNVVELNHISDDEVAYPQQKIDGEHHTKDGTIARKWDYEFDERGHLSHKGKISLKNSINNNNDKELNDTDFLAFSKKHKKDPSLLRNRERSTAREVMTRKIGCRNNRGAQLKSWSPDIVNRDYLQTSSRIMPLDVKTGCCMSRSVGGHDMIAKAPYNSMEAKDRQREESFEEYRERFLENCFARYVPYFDKEDESFTDKCDKGSCSAGASKRFQELDSYDRTRVNLERPYNHQESKIYGGGLHPRIYREANDEDKRGWHEDDSHRNQVPCLFMPDKRYMYRSGQSHTRETMSHLRSKLRIVSSKKYRPFSRTCFNLNDDRLPEEVKRACPDNRDYSEGKNSNLALPGLTTKVDVSIRHQDSNLSSRKRYNFYGTAQLQNGIVGKRSFSERKVYDNHCHNSNGSNLAIRSGNHSYSVGCSDSLSDNFIKYRHELNNWGCRQAVNNHLNGWKIKTNEKCNSRGGRSHVSTDIASFKDSRDPSNNEKSSYYSVELRSSNFHLTNSKVGYSNQMMTKCSNKHPITEVEIEELEEGQLVEESDNHETGEIKCNSDGRNMDLTANAMIDLTNPLKKKKLIGRYGRNHLLETLAKMEKRLERFKDPIPLKKEPENCSSMQPVAAIDDVKQQRPARKRRWAGS